MSFRVRVLGRPELLAGFSLGGLRTLPAGTPREAADRLDELGRAGHTGVVLIENALFEGLPEETRRKLARRPLPMIVPFPGPVRAPGAGEAEAYVVELLRQVVGYRVRLR
jgi:vacuolar-type H+-ATPase subunit F/Vma7